MTKAQQNQFRKALEAKRDELLAEINARRSRLGLDPAGDIMDHARGVGEREVAVGNVDRMNAVLRSVLGALQEIQDGTFGTCEECSREIPAKRLAAVPWSPYCVACQEHLEQRGGGVASEKREVQYALAS